MLFRSVNPYTSCGRLSQQIAVNAYFCVEADRLEYHFRKQHNLRSETYQGISDAMVRVIQLAKMLVCSLYCMAVLQAARGICF